MKVVSSSIHNLNTATLVDSINVVTIKCCCIEKSILMGQMGIPIACKSCKRTWFVSAQANISIQEVLIDLNKESPLGIA